MRRRGDGVGAGAHFRDDTMQARHHALERADQASDLVLALGLRPIGQIARGDGFGQCDRASDGACDGLRDVVRRGNGGQYRQRRHHDHLDLCLPSAVLGRGSVCGHALRLQGDHLVDQRVVARLGGGHLVLVDHHRVVALVGSHQVEHLAHREAVLLARLRLLVEDRLALGRVQELLEVRQILRIGRADRGVLVRVFLELLGIRGQEDSPDRDRAAISDALDLVAQGDLRVAVVHHAGHDAAQAVQNRGCHGEHHQQQRDDDREGERQARTYLEVRRIHCSSPETLTDAPARRRRLRARQQQPCVEDAFVTKGLSADCSVIETSERVHFRGVRHTRIRLLPQQTVDQNVYSTPYMLEAKCMPLQPNMDSHRKRMQGGFKEARPPPDFSDARTKP